MKKDALEIKSAYLKVNDTLDVLNLKEKILGDVSKYGSIGDLDGYDFALRYGVTSKNTVILNYQRWNIAYGDSTLQNKKLEFINKYNLFYNPYSFFNAFTIDVGYTQDSSVPLLITSDASLNALIQKIKPGTSTKLNNGTISKGDSTFTLYDRVGNLIKPYLSIENLKSESYLARVLLGKKLSSNALIDLYLGVKMINIKSAVAFYPDDNALVNKLAGDFKSPNLNRSEKTMELGFIYTHKVDKMIYEFNYEYTKIFRDADVSYTDKNSIVNFIVAREITKDALIYVGGKLMMQQFNTDIPYLYNKYTKTKFDKKYGFASFGAVYRFWGFKMQEIMSKLKEEHYTIKILADSVVSILNDAHSYKVAYFIDETEKSEHILKDILLNNEVRVFKISKQQLEELGWRLY